MVTQMLLLRFQMCAVVNRVVVLHLRHGNSRMPRVVTITDEPNLSATTSRINSRIRWRHITIVLNSHRNAASPKPVAVLHVRNRKSGMSRVIMITDERAKSFRGNFTHSRIRRRRHDRRSTRVETRHRQRENATRATSRIRRNETGSFKYPSIRCYRSNSRYQ